MNVLSVGQFKAQFSDILQQVELGKSVGISYGKSKKKVAVLIPYKKHLSKFKPKLGLLEGKASFKLSSDFKITDEQLLSA